MIRNWYLNELANDIEFLDRMNSMTESYRAFFPFLKDSRREIYNFPFLDFEEDKLESGFENKDVYAICKKAKIPSPILVDCFVVKSSRNTVHLRKRDPKMADPVIVDLIAGQFSAPAPYQKYCIGIGKYETKTQGNLYMCVLIDLYDRSIASVSFSEEWNVEMIDEVFDHVISFSPCRDFIVHSSQNEIFQTEEYHKLHKKYKIKASMTEKGSRGGIMPVSTFFSTVKRRMNGYEFNDLQDGIDYLSVYIFKYNIEIINKNEMREAE